MGGQRVLVDVNFEVFAKQKKTVRSSLLARTQAAEQQGENIGSLTLNPDP
jgi:hypothetical protein